MDLNYPLTRYLYRPVSRSIAARLAPTRATPLQLTLIGAVLVLGGAIAWAQDMYVVGVALVLVGQIIDCVDGDLARISGRTNAAGAFIDSVLDRWTDAALIIGLGWSRLDEAELAMACALAGALVTSYVRARAQSLGVDCPQGIGTRDTRLLVLMIAALVARPVEGLWVVAAMGLVTALHRTLWAMRALRTRAY